MSESSGFITPAGYSGYETGTGAPVKEFSGYITGAGCADAGYMSESGYINSSGYSGYETPSGQR